MSRPAGVVPISEILAYVGQDHYKDIPHINFGSEFL